TKRKMASFADLAQSYYSTSLEINQNTDFEIFQSARRLFKDDVTDGPHQVAKKLGFLIDNDVSLWVSPEVFNNLKREFRLIAGTSQGARTWWVAVPPKDLKDSELLSHIIE